MSPDPFLLLISHPLVLEAFVSFWCRKFWQLSFYIDLMVTSECDNDLKHKVINFYLLLRVKSKIERIFSKINFINYFECIIDFDVVTFPLKMWSTSRLNFPPFMCIHKIFVRCKCKSFWFSLKPNFSVFYFSKIEINKLREISLGVGIMTKINIHERSML